MNSPASIRARLLNTSRQSGEDFQALLTRYAIERFLFRPGERAARIREIAAIQCDDGIVFDSASVETGVIK